MRRVVATLNTVLTTVRIGTAVFMLAYLLQEFRARFPFLKMMLGGDEIRQTVGLLLKKAREARRLKRALVNRNMPQMHENAGKLCGIRALCQKQCFELNCVFIRPFAQQRRKHYFLMTLLKVFCGKQACDSEQ